MNTVESAFIDLVAVFVKIIPTDFKCPGLSFSLGREYPAYASVDKRSFEQCVNFKIFDNLEPDA